MTDEADNARALAVALVAMSKAVSAAIPGYSKNLKVALASAEAAGIDAADLKFLRRMVRSAQQTVQLG